MTNDKPKYDHNPCVLCLIENPATNQFLMVKNLRGMNKGFYNFAGGKLNYGEDIKEALWREVKEETNLQLQRAKFVGRIDIFNQQDGTEKISDETNKDIQVYVFYSNKYKGTPWNGTEEVEVHWFDRDKLPLNLMRDNDKIWLPKVLQGEEVYDRFMRNVSGKTIEFKQYELEEGRCDARSHHEEYKTMAKNLRLAKQTIR